MARRVAAFAFCFKEKGVLMFCGDLDARERPMSGENIKY